MGSQPVNPEPSQGPDFGPCLYLGADGTRCDRLAGEDGFCERHSPHNPANPWAQCAKIIGATILLVAVLWPLLADLLREAGAWLR